MQNNPDGSDLRARYTHNAEKKRNEEVSSLHRKGIVKLIFGCILIVVGVPIMLIDEALLPAGIIPIYFGLNFCISGIVNVSKGMGIDEFPKGIEIVLRLLPLLIAGLVFWFILDNF